MEAAINIGAINTDATNRHQDVNRKHSLATYLAQGLISRRPTVLTLSEVSPSTLHKEIIKYAGNYQAECVNLTSHDRIVQLWDADTYEHTRPLEVSDLGKYMGIPLQHKELRQDHLHVSVHLPYKRGKQRAFELLQGYLEEKEEDYEYVYIHGDFNESRDNLMEQFPDLDFAFDAVTTKAGGKRDNVASLGEVNYENQFVQSNSVFSHHPIYVTAQLED